MDDLDFQPDSTRANTFKHQYCDYDISEMKSSVKSFASSMAETEDGDRDFIVKDERWYDKSSAAYFTSPATRNAQTVSWKQRHRPIFQLYLDLQTAIIVAAIMLISSVQKLRELNKEHSGEITFNFGSVLKGQLVRISVTTFFFLKFFGFALWYRYKGEGNITQNTSRVFMVRNILDLICYGFIFYCIWLETQVETYQKSKNEVYPTENESLR